MKINMCIRLMVAGSVLLCWQGFFGASRAAEPRARVAAGKSVKASEIVANDMGNVPGDFPDAPLQNLYSIIRFHPRSRFFRLNWAFIIGSESADVTAIYDRRKKTVGYYCVGGHNAAGNPAQIVYAHYLYSDVTDTRIRLASNHPVGPFPNAIQQAPVYAMAGTAAVFFDDLLIVGCHRRKLP